MVISEGLMILAGDVQAGVKHSSGWPMDKPSEQNRCYQVRVDFQHPFEERPDVVVGLRQIDVRPGAAGGVGLNVVAVDATAQGFVLQLGTWTDICVENVGVFWLAFGKGKRIV